MNTDTHNDSLVLGTAQFGSSYGIANTVGSLTQDNVTDIVHEAWEQGMRTFDTAQDYGSSETLLGNALTTLGIVDEVKIISKIVPSIDHSSVDTIRQSVEESLEKLKVSQLYGVLIHNENALGLWDMGLGAACDELVRSGKVQKIGVSVYSPDKALQALDISGIDILQVPTNVLDRRFQKAGVFKDADRKNKEIYIRSVFLQGLLFLDSAALPDKVDFAKSVIADWEKLCSDNDMNRHDLALGYLRTVFPKAKLLFGVETLKQLQDNITASQAEVSEALSLEVECCFDHVDEHILNPSLWGELSKR